MACCLRNIHIFWSIHPSAESRAGLFRWIRAAGSKRPTPSASPNPSLHGAVNFSPSKHTNSNSTQPQVCACLGGCMGVLVVELAALAAMYACACQWPYA